MSRMNPYIVAALVGVAMTVFYVYRRLTRPVPAAVAAKYDDL